MCPDPVEFGPGFLVEFGQPFFNLFFKLRIVDVIILLGLTFEFGTNLCFQLYKGFSPFLLLGLSVFSLQIAYLCEVLPASYMVCTSLIVLVNLLF